MMKRLICVFLTVMMLLAGAGLAEEAPGLTKDLVILFTSDVHCGIDQNWCTSGVAALRKALEDQGKYTLLVDDGDFIQGEVVGTMTRGEALIDVMNSTGYDIAIPGNHEFDYGMERFLELREKADFPYISCNFEKDGKLVLDPCVIREFDGVKIAFVGVCTPETLTSTTPRYFQDENGSWLYGFMQDETGEKFYAAVQKAVDDARADGASYVILMAHMGNEGSASPYRYDDLITHISGADALLDGHSHDTEYAEVVDKEGKTVLRQGCGTKLEAIGTLTIGTDGKLSMKLYRWISQDFTAMDLGIMGEAGEAVALATDELKLALSNVIAHSDFDLVINEPGVTDDSGKPIRIVRRAECNLGDLCADAFRDQGGSEIAWINGGSIRVELRAGDITMNDVLSVHPFNNALCVVKVTGQQVLDALEWSSRAVPEEGNFLHVSGLTYEIHTGIPSSCTEDENGMFTGVSGEYRVKNVVVNGEPLDLKREYTLASTDYMLLNQGGGCTMYEGCELLVDRSMFDNQALMAYISQTLGGVIPPEYEDPHGQGRIVAVE